MTEKNARGSRRLRNASEKTQRRGNFRATAESKRLERRERKTTQGVCVQGFRRGIRQHDASGAGRRSDEPSSGMVQRVEQSSDRFEYPQRERHQRLRFQAGREN